MNIDQWDCIYVFLRDREVELKKFESNINNDITLKDDFMVGLHEKLLHALTSCERNLQDLMDKSSAELIVIVLAIHTDEMVKTSTSGLGSRWQLLQEIRSNITNGGLKFFYMIDELLSERAPSIALLEILFFCLQLGFKGRYFNSPDDIDEIKQRLTKKLESFVQRNEYSDIFSLGIHNSREIESESHNSDNKSIENLVPADHTKNLYIDDRKILSALPKTEYRRRRRRRGTLNSKRGSD
ncbi:DotU family type IV/VI secretion system protein [Microbulbifer variabilis]|uniref:DotU family type IV/VI secretion system protein n=1 Tax=Microbulbifer variabilis TaxID=266805 RepID=UPI001CFCF8B5|nr:DotU family type IV/VI secretion system protein [Microbulbifer variabilis]